MYLRIVSIISSFFRLYFLGYTSIGLQAVDGLKLLNEEKVGIGNTKVDIQDVKVDIESVLSEKGSDFSVKTTVHIYKLFEKFGFDEIFGRSAVMELLN